MLSVMFGFEKDLITEEIIKWVAEHPQDVLCRAVIDAHYVVMKTYTAERESVYEHALRELVKVRPWEVAASGLILL